jgi:hypothetical protein
MELFASLYPTEAVQKGCPSEKVLLGFTRCGCGEFEGTHVLELGLGRSRAHHEPRSDEQKGGYTNHRSLLTKMATYTALSLGDAKAGE